MLYEIAGKRFGRYVAISYSGKGKWLCRCDCGSKREVYSSSLRSSLKKNRQPSCGCVVQPVVNPRNTTHGAYKTPEYNSWSSMRARCQNPNDLNYKRYGGRGIRVCRRWRRFECFLADMGKRPSGTSLDRLDNNKGYNPKNCAWRTPKQQARNSGQNRLITYNGQTRCLAEWCELLNIPYKRTISRLRIGWPFKDAVEIPKLHTNQKRHAAKKLR